MNEEKLRLLAMADAFLEVGPRLHDDYEGSYDLSSIEEFFDAIAVELLDKADLIEKDDND